MASEVTLRFPGAAHPAAAVPAGAGLSEVLTPANSPVLFGCRTGICGTCLVEVLEGEPAPADADEREVVEVLAPDHPRARLACQLRASAGMALRPIPEEER